MDKFWDGDICWATPRDLSRLAGPAISDTSRRITSAGLDSCAASLLPVGSVLFSSRAPIGHVAINTVPMATNQGFKNLIPIQGRAHASYLYHWLRCNRSYLEGLGNGATFKEVSKSVVERVELPLPAIAEQRRIAAILDQAETLRAQRRAAIAQLDSLGRTIFAEMFEGATPNSLAGRIVELGEATQIFAGGSLPVGEPFVGQPDGYLLMKVSDMNLEENEVYILHTQRWSRTGGQGSCICPHSSIVFPKRGGAIATNKKRLTVRPTALDPNLMALMPRESLINAQYLYYWLLSFDLSTIANGSSVPQLNKQDLKPLLIQIPPLAQQQLFDTRIQGLTRLKSTHRTALTHLDDLFASLQHRAFRGEL